MPDRAIFCTATNRVIDFVRSNEDDARALARLTPEYGTALVAIPSSDAARRYEDAFKSPPVEITEARFILKNVVG